MTTKISTAEELQNEIRTLLAMTEEEAPSRARLAAALSDLASRVAGHGDALKRIQDSQPMRLIERRKDMIEQELKDISSMVSRVKADPHRFQNLLDDLTQSLKRIKVVVDKTLSNIDEVNELIKEETAAGNI